MLYAFIVLAIWIGEWVGANFRLFSRADARRASDRVAPRSPRAIDRWGARPHSRGIAVPTDSVHWGDLGQPLRRFAGSTAEIVLAASSHSQAAEPAD